MEGAAHLHEIPWKIALTSGPLQDLTVELMLAPGGDPPN
jgi:hypothetical protein